MMLVFNIVDGGSGFGGSTYEKWSSGCLVKLDREEQAPEIRERSGVFDTGSALHGYMEMYFRVGNVDRLDIRLPDGSPLQEDQHDQAWRLFEAFLADPVRSFFDSGRVLGIEEQLEGKPVDDAFGVSPITGRTDLRIWLPAWTAADGTEYEEGIYLVDWKSCSSWASDPAADRADYGYKSYATARIRYCKMSNVLGLGPVKGMIYVQFKKLVKTCQVRMLDPVPFTEFEFLAYKRYLEYCIDRRDNYPREFLLSQCFYCKFNNSCSKGVVI